jgi:hypothetical protein
MTHYFLVLQNVNIEEKIKKSPDEAYQLGVLIGSFIPFVLLAAIAYWTYYYAKKRKE